MLTFINSKSYSGQTLTIDEIQEGLFPNKDIREIEHMLHEINSFDSTILKIRYDGGSPFYVSRGHNLTSFLQMGGGFHEVFKNHSNHQRQLQERDLAAHKANEATITAGKAAYISAIAAIIAIAISVISWLYLRDSNDLENRVRALEKQMQSKGVIDTIP